LVDTAEASQLSPLLFGGDASQEVTVSSETVRLAKVGTPALMTRETEWKMPRVEPRPGPFHAARSRRPRLTGSTRGTSDDVPAGRRRRTLTRSAREARAATRHQRYARCEVREPNKLGNALPARRSVLVDVKSTAPVPRGDMRFGVHQDNGVPVLKHKS